MTTETPPPQISMLERYGGVKFVMRFTLQFYDKVLASRRLAPFFANTNMQELVEHQAKFISAVMGGPTSHSNPALRDLHSHLSIDDQAFDEMILLFRKTLEEPKLADGDVETIMANLNARRAYIVR